MKKVLSIFVWVSLCSFPSWGQRFSAVNADGDTLYYRITRSIPPYTVEVTYRGNDYDAYGNEYRDTLVIPETVNYYGISYSINSIGYCAFYGCSDLASVSIPSSVTSIGEKAFSYCHCLRAPVIPPTVTHIGKSAFRDMKNIICHGVSEENPWDTCLINGYAEGDLIYSDSTKTTVVHCASTVISVTLPSSVTTIDNSAFAHCHNLSSITIPSSVITIGASAFLECYSLSLIILQSTVPPAWTSIHSGYPYYQILTSFDYLPDKVDIRVPAGSATAYQTDASWSVFANAIHPNTLHAPDE